MNLRVMSVDGAYNWLMLSIGLLILVAAVAVVAFWTDLIVL